MATQRVLAVLLALALAQLPVRAQQPQDFYVIQYSDSTCRRKTGESYGATSGRCWDYPSTGSAMADCDLNRTWLYTSSDDCRGAVTRTSAVGDCTPDPFGGYSRFECRNAASPSGSSKCPDMYEWWVGIAPGSRAFEYRQGSGSDTLLLCLSKGTLFNDTLLDPVVQLGQDIGYVFQESKLPCKVFSNSFGIPVNASSGETTEGQCPLLDEPLNRCEYPEERLRGQDSWGGVSFKISMVNGKHTTEGSTPNVAIHPPYNPIFYNASHQMVFGSNGSSCVDERVGTRYTSGVMLTRSPLTDMTYRSFMFANEAERLAALNDSRNEGLPYARKIVGSNGCDVEIVFEFKPNATGGLDVVMSQIPQTTFSNPATPGYTEERARIRELLAGNTSAYIDVDMQQVIVQVESAALRASQYLPVRDCDNGTTTTVKFSTQFICKATGNRVNITDIKFARSDGNHHALSTDPSNPTYFQLDRNNPSTCWNNITCLGRNWAPDFFLSIADDAAPVSCGSFYWDPLLEAVPGDGSSATAFSTSTDVQIEVSSPRLVDEKRKHKQTAAPTQRSQNNA